MLKLSGMVRMARAQLAARRLDEEKLYERVLAEVAGGHRRDGIWVKCLADANGDIPQARSAYIKARVQSIKDERTMAVFVEPTVRQPIAMVYDEQPGGHARDAPRGDACGPRLGGERGNDRWKGFGYGHPRRAPGCRRSGMTSRTDRKRLVAAAEAYFAELARVRASGGSTVERSSYGPVSNLLNTVGAMLSPKVFCVGELADQGAGHPDFGLYAARQVQRKKPRPGQTPERGVVEVKGVEDDAWVTAAGAQGQPVLEPLPAGSGDEPAGHGAAGSGRSVLAAGRAGRCGSRRCCLSHRSTRRSPVYS